MEIMGAFQYLMITMMLPSLLLAKIAGDVIDKYDSKKTMILAIAFEILFIIGVCIFNMQKMPKILYLFSFISYTVEIFIRLYLQSSVVHIAKQSHYLKVNSILNGAENLGVILGPICGGALIENFQVNYAFFILGACFFITLISIIFLRIPKPLFPDIVYSESNSTTTKIRGSFDEIKKIFFTVCLFSFSIGLVNVRQISFVITQYNTAEFGYSLTESAWGFGMIIGCFIILLFNQRAHPERTLGCCYLFVGSIVLLLTINTRFILGVFLFLLIGVGNIIISIAATTWVQQSASLNSMGKNLGKKTMYQQIFTITAMILGGFLDSQVSSNRLYGFAAIILILGGVFILLYWKDNQK